MSNLKQQLYVACGEYIRTHEADIRKAIVEAQEAANNESKGGTTGDSETGREVMQQEIELNLTRLNEINKLKTALDQIPFDHINKKVQPGSIVKTNNGSYYLAISAGQLKVEGTTYYAISPGSPIGSKMIDLASGDEFSLNGKDYKIESVS